MNKLCVKLPPFSPDYSGVCSAIFDLNCIAVIHDASGCTGNYTGYDEPRWYGSRSAVFCSGLREIDAVLGDDEKLIQKVLQAAESLKPDFIAIIGSPVPMVIGADLRGIAADIELRTKIPCIGFDTTGTGYFPDGIAEACIALLERFTLKTDEKKLSGVNLLGVTPLLFGSETISSLKNVLLQNDLELVASFCEGLTMQAIQNAAQASLNLVVSQAGIQPARYLEKKFGIPYLVGAPIGKKAQADWVKSIFSCIEEQATQYPGNCPGNAEILILGDGVLCKAWQMGLQSEFGVASDCGCIFGAVPGLFGEDMLDLDSEYKISEAINSGKYTAVIGDPMFRALIRPDTELDFLDYPIYCVSSKMSNQKQENCIGEGLNSYYPHFTKAERADSLGKLI
ncbi:nitrogenase component 1 type oxidoreductase [Anaerobacterium chartisolvens]|uniref:Nitrogenase component 1 type oxidoreductase n=1 Tax=Anaerobacterium chartisolvens TaxID=1297424 RepID=A0A369BI15_9FIRM|nr:nitrogenase component 1 [Anaerobacterium chartisolvens]RCX19324.1 nitrogenase component 1 type oxidoreductase [Anaerobacterium chartisolvens]